MISLGTFLASLLAAGGSVWTATPIGLDAITNFDAISTLRYAVRTYQADSHDPTGGNNDAYQYLQVVGSEQILMDVKGPGCVYSIWMTGFDPAKRIKIYLDGSITPVVNMTMSNFFSGNTSPFLAPLVDDDSVSSGGFYCDLPIPFREGCRITSTGARYYHITYQKYASAAGITTFTGGENSSTARSMWNNSGTDPKSDTGSSSTTGTVTIPVGQTVTVADINSAGSIQRIEFTIPGLTTGNVTDEGRAFTGYSQFQVAINSSNSAVRLKRRLHYGVGNQKARVLVDGVNAGEWYTPGAADTWLDSTFNIPSNLTAGKSNITVKIEFISSALDWNEFYYWVYSVVSGSHQLTDQVNVGNTTSESSHGYTINGQQWSGSRTFPSTWKSIIQDLDLKIYWDNSGTPSVNADMCQFFGTGLGPYRVDALPIGIDGTRLYCYFPMPFNSRAQVKIYNAGNMDADGVSYTIRYNTYGSALSNVGKFCAVALGQAPITVGTDYTMLNVSGSGHFVGVVHTMEGPDTERSYLEGDERIYVDGSKTPQLYGTGTEDFYSGGWYFSNGPFTLPVHGNAAHEVSSWDSTSCYRYLLSDLIPFTTSLKVGMETYIAGSDYFSVAYYYSSPSALATLTDQLNVGNSTSESAHGYSRTGQTWSGTSNMTFEGDDDGTVVSDNGRRIGLGGTTQFTMAISSSNGGVLLRRRMDYSHPRQRAEIFVDGMAAGTWYDAGENDYHSFRESEFLIPAFMTAGKSSITISTVNTSIESDWSEYHYWAYTYAPEPNINAAPVIVEAKPDLDIAVVGVPYTKQLRLSQGYPAPTWSVVSAPAGVSVSGTGVVSGWTPAVGQVGNTLTFTIRATNAQGYDDETWQVKVSNVTATYQGSTGLSHLCGSAVGTDWRVTAADGNCWMAYGPYTTSLPTGSLTARFWLRVNNNTADDADVCRIDVWDATANQNLAGPYTISRADFQQEGVYQAFDLAFTNPSGGHSLEFRTYYFDADILLDLDKVDILGGTLATYQGSSGFYHLCGAAISGDDWRVTVAVNNCFMAYGPYATSLPAGNLKARFWLRVDNNTYDNATICQIDVYDATSGVYKAGPTTITRQQFTQAGVYQAFDLNFTNVAGHSMEFRTYYIWYAQLDLDKVEILPQ